MTERQKGALDELRGGIWPVLDERSERERRERIAARILQLSGELRVQRERRRRVGLSLLLAAIVAGVCALVLTSGAGLFERPTASAPAGDAVRLVAGRASVRAATGLAPLAPGQLALPADSTLITPADESAELVLSSDTALRVAPASELSITREPSPGAFEERVRLRAGSVALSVPKLGARGKVSVETRDTVVEVHGTQFSVRVVERPPLEPFTEVVVREGRVMVSSGEQRRYLDAGDRWSSTPEAPAASSAPRPSAAEPARQAPASEPPRAGAASALAAQNRLFEAAQLAQKNGEAALALQRLEALIKRYPDSELAHNARVERFRLLAHAGRQRDASLAAKAYLKQHPDGFARREAEQLVEAAPAASPR